MKLLRKKSVLIITLILLTALIITSLPHVWHKKSTYGTELPQSELLSLITKNNLSKYILDTAQNAQAVVALHDEKIVLEVGDTEKLINCHSARKSIMSLLIGIAKEKGFLKLDETLGQLGIDESKMPLTKQEKSATIRDLLMARSGVYLPGGSRNRFCKSAPAKKRAIQTRRILLL